MCLRHGIPECHGSLITYGLERRENVGDLSRLVMQTAAVGIGVALLGYASLILAWMVPTW